MRKRVLALSLASAMAITSLAACNSNGGDESTAAKESATNSSEETTTKSSGDDETDATETEEEVAMDLGGMEIVIGDWWTDPDAEPTTAQEEATVAYRQEIMEKYNFTITQKSICGWGDMQELYVQSVQGEDPAAQVFVLDSSFVAQPMANNLFYDLATLDNLDLSDDKWNQTTIDLMTRGDSVYGLSYGASEPRTGVFFNKRLLKECGYDEDYIYDLQADGEWTWEAFEELCEACTKDTDGDGVNDIYAMASFSKDFLPAATASNGAEWVGMDDDGYYTNATTSAEFLEAANWAADLWSKYEMPQPEDSEWNWFVSAFHDGKVVMTIAEEYKVGDWADMDDDWGFVMFPKKDEDSEYVHVSRDNIWVIPSCYSEEEAEKIAFALSLWANPTPGYEGDDDWAYSYYASFRDDRAVDETLAMMRDEKYQALNYTPLIYGLDLGDIAYEVYARQSTPQECIEAVESQWDARIADANSSF